MTAKSEIVGVVAVITKTGSLFKPESYDDLVVLELEPVKLVPESALAELFDSSLKAQSVHTATVAELHAAEAKLTTLLSGLEALAARMEALEESDVSIGESLAYGDMADELRALIPAAANTESEETQ
jgi:hypothetical protein